MSSTEHYKPQSDHMTYHRPPLKPPKSKIFQMKQSQKDSCHLIIQLPMAIN